MRSKTLNHKAIYEITTGITETNRIYISNRMLDNNLTQQAYLKNQKKVQKHEHLPTVQQSMPATLPSIIMIDTPVCEMSCLRYLHTASYELGLTQI